MNILVFSPHPDDAEIAMGGTIAKYVKLGHKVLTVIVTMPKINKDIRQKESVEALRLLGSQYINLDIFPYDLEPNRKIVEIFDRVLKEYPPDIIYTSWLNDSHQDHATVSKVTIASTRENISSLYMYRVLPSGITLSLFENEVYVDISDFIDLKNASLMAHKSQYEKYGENWINGVNAMSIFMGSRINVRYAESFQVVKEIHKIGVPSGV